MRVLSGHFGLARPWFEEAFELVPKGGIEECKVRVNLGLTYEALGDEARARADGRVASVLREGTGGHSRAPAALRRAEGGETGEQLDQAEERMEEKNQPQPARMSSLLGGEPADSPSRPRSLIRRAPSQEQQDLLREQQRQNTIERNEQRGTDDRDEPEGGGGSYPRPW